MKTDLQQLKDLSVITRGSGLQKTIDDLRAKKKQQQDETKMVSREIRCAVARRSRHLKKIAGMSEDKMDELVQTFRDQQAKKALKAEQKPNKTSVVKTKVKGGVAKAEAAIKAAKCDQEDEDEKMGVCVEFYKEEKV